MNSKKIKDHFDVTNLKLEDQINILKSFEDSIGSLLYIGKNLSMRMKKQSRTQRVKTS